MSQDEVEKVLRQHEGTWMSIKQISALSDSGRVSTTVCARRLYYYRKYHGFNDIHRDYRPRGDADYLSVVYKYEVLFINGNNKL